MNPRRFDNTVAPLILLVIVAGLALLHFWEDAALWLLIALVALLAGIGIAQFIQENRPPRPRR